MARPARTRLSMLPSAMSTLDLRTVVPDPPEKRTEAIYGSVEHKAWREKVLARAGYRCQGAQHDPAATRSGKLYADHVRELRDGGAPFDLMNGVALCASCHTRKTAAERDRRALAPRRGR